MSTSYDIHAPADQPWKLWHILKLLFVFPALKYWLHTKFKEVQIFNFDITFQHLAAHPAQFVAHLAQSLHKLKRLQMVPQISIASQLLQNEMCSFLKKKYFPQGWLVIAKSNHFHFYFSIIA